jgi:hypothetical protein
MTNRTTRIVESTWAGQATWADPNSGHTCRECIFWAKNGDSLVCGNHLRPRYGKDGLAPRPCQMARRLNNNINVPVPHDAKACAYFAASNSPPPMGAKRRSDQK